MDVLVGTRVVRGPDWTWGDQDGGEGHVGTVAEVLRADRPGVVDQGCPGPCVVTVQWDCGNRCRYRCGVGDRYDLRVIDSAPAGIKHQRIMCSACGLQLTGMRWKCIRCGDCDLCTYCYMSGKHELDHEFDRMDTPRIRVRIPTRASSKKKEARGIYQHAEVIPGRDWVTPTTNQGAMDGFIYGEVVNILGSNGENSRGFAEVKWSESQASSIHRVGSEGKVELRCVEPSCVSYYYPDHLPDLGAPVDEDEVIQSGDIASGDYVKVELDLEVFRAMHEGSEQAGWDDHMMEILGEIGRVQRVFENGNLRIRFPLHQRWTICADAVTKVYGDLPPLCIGDTVCITTDDKKLAQVYSLKEELGHYFSMFYGETCRVMDLSPGGLVTIAAKEKIWYFPPPFLEVYDDLSSLPWSNPLPHVNNLEALSNYLKKNPDQVDRRQGGRTALHCATVTRNTELIKLLLKFGANKEAEESLEGENICEFVKCSSSTNVSAAITSTNSQNGCTTVVEILISAGADMNTKGYNGNTPLILAANGGHAGVARLLLNHPNIDIHDQDVDGNTALHVAVLTQHVELVSMLVEAGADPARINFRIVTPIIEAARIGLSAAIKLMILHNPESVKVTNDYLYNIIHTATLNDHRDIIPIAIEGGLDVNSQDDMGHTALHFAIQNGNTSVIEQLVKHGADVNARDADDVTPLYMIIMYRDILDIPSSACPEIKKFHNALMGKLPDNVNRRYFPMSLLAFFLKKGADIHIETKGQSPIRVLPYLAELMTIVAENEELLSEHSTFTSKDGILCRYGHRPYIIDSTGDKSSTLPMEEPSSISNSSSQQSRRPYGSYFSSYGQQQSRSESGRRDYGRQSQMTEYKTNDRPTRMAGTSSSSYPIGPNSRISQQQRQQSYSKSQTAENNNSIASTISEVSTCFLCDSPANVKFQPCGHSDMCSQCAARAKKCPTCRKTVSSYSCV